jgi:nitroreductase
MNEVLNVIKKRRSVRTYTKQQLSQEDLDLIIEAGIYAPTANNEQPWHFTVVQDPEMLARINAECSRAMALSDNEWMRKMGANPAFRVTYNAPTLIIVSGKKDATAFQADCSTAIQNMILAGSSLGIGSVWLGLVNFFFGSENAARDLGIPDGYKPFYGVAFGYNASDKEAAGPKRNTDVVNFIR